MSDNINNLAFSFFSGLVICSLLSDSYIILNNFLKNNYIKKKINYFKNLYKIITSLAVNSFKSDEEGNIIIDNIELKKSSCILEEEIETNYLDNEYSNDILKDIEKDFIDESKNMVEEIHFSLENKEEEILNNLEEKELTEEKEKEFLNIVEEKELTEEISNNIEDSEKKEEKELIEEKSKEKESLEKLNEEEFFSSSKNINIYPKEEDIKIVDPNILKENTKIVYKQMNTKKSKSKKNIQEVVIKKLKKID